MSRVVRHRRQKIRRTANTVSACCLICISLVSVLKMADVISGYRTDQNTYQKVQEENENESDRKIDFAALKKTNPDVIGWICIEDTSIDYPVVQSHDNREYLSLKYDKSSGGCGSIFTDYRTDDAFNQFNTIIYGHHMSDGSMFHDLDKYKDESFAKSHPEIELFTPEGKYLIRVAAFMCVKSDSDIYDPSPVDRKRYISIIKDSARYLTDLDLGPDDRLVLLSTCAYEYRNARYVLAGKLTAI